MGPAVAAAGIRSGYNMCVDIYGSLAAEIRMVVAPKSQIRTLAKIHHRIIFRPA
ncbi:hypothetical protein Lbir_0361 [Legionella birminghamensis]|uniref:Uncharacterized protein n=1 Tax=Legionella birminghamensis TaxID=28083 RepID=A0A378IKL6_9GAMM|nr:hypothetical protein Lbir_0361 [Legionella birminghamensis]STX32674.1 Uncharacterised protein [Legionella birminghamensis]